MDGIHLNSLPEISAKVILKLAKLPIWNDFYLAGGSGLALQINHRISVDFDLFSYNNRLTDIERERLKKIFSDSESITIRTSKDWTLEVVLNGVLISFFYYDYPLVEPLLKFNSIKIASLSDIGLMKLASIVGRGSKKDFIDIYFILKEHTSLEQLLILSKEKFKEVPSFNIQALQALVYFEDADLERMPKMIREVNWTEVKDFIRKQVRTLSKKWITKQENLKES